MKMPPDFPAIPQRGGRVWVRGLNCYGDVHGQAQIACPCGGPIIGIRVPAGNGGACHHELIDVTGIDAWRLVPGGDA